MNKFRLNTITIAFFILLSSCTFSEKHLIVNQCDMEPAIMIGDKVEYKRFNDELTYGDIVVSNVYKENNPNSNWVFLSRVIGLPGDRIAVENDICIINGQKNEYKLIDKRFSFYEYEETLPNGIKFRIFSFAPYDKSLYKTITIPNNHYFLMSDYRNSNMNSRVMGPVPREQIIGKVTKVSKQ